MAFDLSALAIKDTTDLQLKHPVTGEDLFADGDAKQEPIVATIHSTSSKQYRTATMLMQNRALKRQADKKKATAEQYRAESIDLLVSCTDKISNLNYNGAPVDNTDTIRTLFNDPQYSWIKDQIDSCIAEYSNFLEV